MTFVRFALAILVSLSAAAWTPPSADANTCGLAVAGGGRVPVRSRCRPFRSPARPTLDVASPEVEGPVTGGNGVAVVQGTSFDLADVDYFFEEFFLSGAASAFVNLGELRTDGLWKATPAGTAEYKTRIVVYRPIDDARFSGTVVVEWLNVSGGLDASPDWSMMHTEIIREGHVWVGVSAQFIGVEGAAGGGPIPGLELFLKGADSDRYGTLSHPGDSFSYDIYSQVAQALRSPTGIDPLHGLLPERLIATGQSQSGFRLTTYINAIAPLHGIYDAYLVHGRGNSAASLSQEPEPSIPAPNVVHIRDDLAPVLMYQTETDVIRLGSYFSRQPDSRWFRLWEVAGSAHGDVYLLRTGFTDVGDDPSVFDVIEDSAPIPGIIECSFPLNAGPQALVLRAALEAVDRWVRTGQAPRRAPRMEVMGGEEPELVRDELGNVIGGIRTSFVDVPVAALSGLGQEGGTFCGLFGTTALFDDATLADLYPDHETYVGAIRSSTNRAVFQGYVRPADGALIIEGAEQSGIGG